MHGSTQLEVASIGRAVGRKRINAEGKGEEMTARFAPGTMARIKAALAPGEPKSALLREAVERELQRREDDRA